jgi:hypothetical protein
VHRDLFYEVYGAAILSFYAFEISSHDIVVLASGYAQREFPMMVGVEIPPGFLIGSAANPDVHAVGRVVVRAPDRTKN